MNKSTRPFLAVLAILAAAGLFVIKALPPISPRGLLGGTRRTPFYAARGTELVLTRVVGRSGGRRSWEFRARRIYRSLDGLTITGETINEGRIYDGTKIRCTFGAGYVRYQVLTRLFRIGGGITGRLSDATVFTAAEGTADLGRQILTIPGQVKVEGKEIKMHADGLTADLKAEIVTLRGNVAVTWSGGTINAEEVVYAVKDGTFSVQGTPGKGVELDL